MRRITLLLVGMLALFSTTAQRKNFTYKFYGFVICGITYSTFYFYLLGKDSLYHAA